MRWLVIHPGPSWSVADVFNGWVEALDGLGEKVFAYDLDNRLQFFTAALFETGNTDANGYAELRRACTNEQAIAMAAENIGSVVMNCRPHVVLGISAFFTPPPILQAIRAAGVKVVLLHTEAPYQDDEQLVRAAHADLNLVNDPVSISRYREHGAAEYMPHAFRPQVHHPGAVRADLKSDLCFVGTGFPSRQRFFEAMNLDGLDVLLGGGWPGLPEGSPLRKYLLDPEQRDLSVENMRCLDNEDTAEIYRSAKTSLNLYRREGEDTWDGQAWAVGPREVELAACGLWFARDPRGESGELFPMLPSFTDPAEAAELIRWAVAHDQEREKAAAAARAAVADRTFEANAKRLLKLLDNQLGADYCG